MKIFIGFYEVANVVTNYAKGFRALGHEVYTTVCQPNPFYTETNYDLFLSDVIPAQQSSLGKRLLSLGKWKRVMLSQFVRALWMHDVFIFVYATSFFPNFVDYAILKLFRKKIVSVFLGSDVRYWYAYREQLRSLKNSQHSSSDIDERFYGHPDNFYETQLSKVKAAERYSDLILSQPD